MILEITSIYTYIYMCFNIRSLHNPYSIYFNMVLYTNGSTTLASQPQPCCPPVMGSLSSTSQGSQDPSSVAVPEPDRGA